MKKYINLILVIFLLLIYIQNVKAIGIYPVVNSDMVLYYHFNNNSLIGENNTFQVDNSRTSINGTANNTLFQSNLGILNDGSLFFNGINSSIYLGDNLDIINNSLSFCVWVNTISFATTQYIISKQNGAPEYDLLIEANTGNVKSLFRNATTNIALTSIRPLNIDNNYHYICTTYNITDGNVSLFIDGWFDGSNIQAIGMGLGNSGHLRIGSQSSGGSYLNGSIDELIFYNSTITQKDIISTYLNYTNNTLLNLMKNSTFLYNNIIIYLKNNSFYNIGTTATHEIGHLLKINGENVTLNCQNATINGSYINPNYDMVTGIIGNNNNFSITNCNFLNWWHGLDIKGNISKVYNNYFSKNTRGLEIYSHFNLIYYNNIKDGVNNAYGLYILSNSSYNHIYNNSFSNIDWNAIQIKGNYNNISYNEIYNSTHDSIDFLCNTPNNGIDIDCYNSSYNIVEYNNITMFQGTGVSTTPDCSYFYSTSKNILRFNRYTKNIILIDYCFTFDALSFGNQIYNNSIYNYDGYFYSIANASNNNIFNNFLEKGYYFSDTRNGGAINITIQDNFINIILNNFTGTIWKNTTTNVMFINHTGLRNDGDLTINQLTTFLAYNTNGSTYGSQVIANNNGDINITLGPNNATYILDNFNLTEGVTRQASPLSITSPTTTSKTITSTLTNTINTSVRIYTNLLEQQIQYITYASSLGTENQTIQNADLIYSGGFIDLNNINVDAGNNALDIVTTSEAGLGQNYNCGGVTTQIQNTITFTLPLVVILGIIMILASLGVFSGNGFNIDNADWSTFGVVALGVVAVGVILLIGMIIISNIPC